MTDASDRYRAADIARHRRTLANSAASTFEREVAQAALDKLETPPICRWCLQVEASHNGGTCPVLYRFRLKHGKGLVPAESQALEVRKLLADEDAAKLAAARRKDAKSRQTKLFG